MQVRFYEFILETSRINGALTKILIKNVVARTIFFALRSTPTACWENASTGKNTGFVMIGQN